MTRYEFTLILKEPSLSDKDCAALFEAGCEDGTVVTRDGVTYIAFDREADSLEVAVSSAVVQVMNAGHVVARAEVNDGKRGEDSRRVLWTPEHLVQDLLGEYFCHFVALSGCYHAIDSSGQPTDHAGAFHVSGFILEVEDQWYWVTAAHVFDDLEHGIETLRQERKIQIDKCVLNDSFALPRRHSDPIQFSYQDFEPIKCHDPRLGLDFCAIKLRSHYRQLLLKNGVVPLSEANWKHPDFSQLDHFFMIGLPQELEDTDIALEADGYRVRTRPQPAAVYISPAPPAREESVGPVTRFVGHVDKTAGNVVGMSGGPIFGKRLGDSKHYLVAVQSSRSTRTQGLIFGCPVTPLISRLLEK